MSISDAPPAGREVTPGAPHDPIGGGRGREHPTDAPEPGSAPPLTGSGRERENAPKGKTVLRAWKTCSGPVHDLFRCLFIDLSSPL